MVVYSCGAKENGHDSAEPVLTPSVIDMKNDKVPIIDIGSGYFHSLALDKKHRLIGFGDNDYGQINVEPASLGYELPQFHKYFQKNKIEIKLIRVGYCHSLCIDFDGNCYLFGSNTYDQVGNGNTSVSHSKLMM